MEAEVTALLKQVTALREAKKETEAIQVAEKALALAERSFPAGSDKLVRPLGVLGWAYYGQNRYGESEKLLLRALEIREKTDWLAQPNGSAFCLILASVYFNQSKLDATAAIYKRCSDFGEPLIVAKKLRPDDPSVHEVNNLLQDVYVAQAKPEDAIRLLKRRIALTEQALGYDHPYVGDLLNTLASLYDKLARMAEAGPLYERSLSITEKALANPNADLGPSLKRDTIAGKLNAAAQYYDKTGQRDRAKAIFELARRAQTPVVAVEAKRDDDPEALARQAQQYDRDNRAAEAEAQRRRIAAYWEKILSSHPDDKKAARQLKEISQKLAWDFYQASRYLDAEPFYKRVLSLQARDGDKFGAAETLDTLAELFAVTGRYDEADAAWKKELELREAKQGVEHQDVTMLRVKIYKFYADHGRRAEAAAMLERNREAAQRMNAPTSAPREVLADFDNWRKRPDTRSRYNPAEWLILDTAYGATEYVGVEHPLIGQLLTTAGRLMADAKNWRDAEALLSRAASIQIANLRLSAGTAQPATTPALPALQDDDMRVPQTPTEWANATFGGLLKAGYRLAQQEAGQAPALRDRLFETAQWGQHSAAAAALTQMTARQNNPKLNAFSRERQDLINEWQELDKQLATHLALPAEQRHLMEREEDVSRKRSAWIEDRISEIDHALASEFPRYAELVHPEPLNSGEVQALLQDGEALVLFYDVPPFGPEPGATFVWSVTKTGVHWAKLDLDGAAMTERVQALRCGLDPSSWLEEGEQRCQSLLGTRYTAAEMEKGKPLPFDVRKSYELYRAVLGPIEGHVADKQLLIIPVGALTALPFQVLVTNDPGPGPVSLRDFASLSWLGVRQPLTVLPSVPSLKALRKLVKEGRASKPFIGFGDPLLTGSAGQDRSAWEVQDCRKATVGSAAAPRAVSAPAPTASARAMADVDFLRRQQPLPETAGELCSVARSLGAEDSDVWLGERATVSSVKALSSSGELAAYRTIHFATHGLVAGDLRTLSEPALVLTPPETPGETDVGLLKASDVTQLQLDAQWVVMSACNTAAGGKPGAEALSGLARAFFYAGGRALLVSHWPVNSNAATELTTGTFSTLASSPETGRAEALRRTMATMVRSTEVYKHHPSYWAPFVLVGDGGR